MPVQDKAAGNDYQAWGYWVPVFLAASRLHLLLSSDSHYSDSHCSDSHCSNSHCSNNQAFLTRRSVPVQAKDFVSHWPEQVRNQIRRLGLIALFGHPPPLPFDPSNPFSPSNPPTPSLYPTPSIPPTTPSDPFPLCNPPTPSPGGVRQGSNVM